MKRQEFLLNLTLVTVIGAFGYLLYDDSQNEPDLATYLDVDTELVEKISDGKTAVADSTEETTASNYKNFGDRKVFRALLTPTPTPTPSPTPPPPTPNIGTSLAHWKFLSPYDGKAMLEDVQKSATGDEGAVWEMRVGDTVQVNTGDTGVKTVTLTKIDESDPYDPAVQFKMEGTTAEKTIKLTDEPSAAPPPGGPRPGGQPPQPGQPPAPGR